VCVGRAMKWVWWAIAAAGCAVVLNGIPRGWSTHGWPLLSLNLRPVKFEERMTLDKERALAIRSWERGRIKPNYLEKFGWQVIRLPLFDRLVGVSVPAMAVNAAVVPCAFMVIRYLRWSRTRHRDGVCRGCGYNLTGNVSGVCPECGRPVSGSRAQVQPAHDQRVDNSVDGAGGTPV